MITYMLAVLASYAGIILGCIAAYMAREELRESRRYLQILLALVAGAGALFAGYGFGLPEYISLPIAAAVIFICMALSWSSYLVYLVFAASIGLLTNDVLAVALLCSLVLAYGMLLSAYNGAASWKEGGMMMAKYIFYPLLAIAIAII